MRFSQLVTRFLEWCQVHRKPRTTDFYRDQLKGVCQAVGDPLACELCRKSLLGVKLSWHRLWALQRLYSWAVNEAEIIAHNPFAGMKRPKIGGRCFVMGRRELAVVFRKASAPFRRLMLCQRETAARPQEGRSFRWEQITLVDPNREFWSQVLGGFAYFYLEEFKSFERLSDQNDKRFIPISPRLGRLLFRLWTRGNRAGIIFRNANGEAWTKDAIISQVRRIRQRAVLPAGRSLDKFCLYTMRHSSATDWVRKGLNLKFLAEVLGHKALRTTSRYLHLCKGDVMEELRRRWIRKREEK